MVAGHLQEKKGYFYMVVTYQDEAGKRQTRWISTGLPIKGNKRKAEAMLLEFRQNFKIESPKSAEEAMLFADYMLYWLRLIKPDIELDTYAGYRSNIEYRIAPYFRERQITLGGLKAIHIQDFYTYCMTEGGVSNNTVIHYHANIGKALKYARRKKLIQTNPMEDVDRPKLPQHIGRFYSLDEMDELIRLMKGDPLEFAILMAAFYGLRRSEICGLRWSSVDFKDNTISINHTVVETHVNGKNTLVPKERTKNKSSSRTLPLVPQYRKLLQEMKARQEQCRELCGEAYEVNDYIYVDDLGRGRRPNYITQRFAMLIKKLGLRKITFHELRHSCASLLLKSGVSMKDIQAWLGHSDFSTTANIYAHLEVDSKRNTGAVMAKTLDLGRIHTA